MADLMVIDVLRIEEGLMVKNKLKRNMVSLENVSVPERESKINELREEIDSLYKYIKEGLLVGNFEF